VLRRDLASVWLRPLDHQSTAKELAMKAVCWMGKEKMQVHDVPDPRILNPRDAIVRITSTCICGSDLHLYDGFIPTMEQGDIMGHEFMGEVVEVGPGVDKEKLKVGDRVVVPFTIACGNCQPCKEQLWSCCDNSNPNAWIAEKLMGYSPSGLFGYTHMLAATAADRHNMLACRTRM
jgi:threonine dehydrogenase-like Zn-dependent dehydrogenase